MTTNTNAAQVANNLRAVAEDQAFEAWYKQDCLVGGINARLAARAAWNARAAITTAAGAVKESLTVALPPGIARDDTVHGEMYYTAEQVRAMLAQAGSVLEDAALLDFIAQHPEMSLRHRKGKWAFVGFTNYEYEMLPSLREAIRAARKQGANHD